MTKHLQRDLEHLKKQLLSVGTLVEEATTKSIAALTERRGELAEEVLQGDDQIDTREVQVEEDCLKALALHQPVAADLRFIVAVMKVNNDLERMGDLAVNIAGRAQYLSRHDPIRLPVDVPRMAEAVRSMVRQSLDALIKRDPAVARRVLADDEEVDRLHGAMFKAVQDLMRKDSETIERAVATLSVSRYLERIADLATNIAEDVLFMIEGELVRHQAGG